MRLNCSLKATSTGTVWPCRNIMEKLPDDHELVKNGHGEDSISQRCTPADLGGAVEFKSSGPVESGYSGMNYAQTFQAVIEKCFRNDYE